MFAFRRASRCGVDETVGMPLSAGDAVILSYLETWRCGPGAVARNADDAGLVDVAGANQADGDRVSDRTLTC